MAIDYNLGRIAEQEDYDIVFSDHLPIEAYASAFRAAGFHDFAVHIPDLEPPAETADEGDYWDYLLDNPFLLVIDCVRD